MRDRSNRVRRTIPFIRPNPPTLSTRTAELQQIEASGSYTNHGPNSRLLEARLSARLGPNGACLTVANATIGLMLAIKQAVGWQPRGRYALMPSFTFAATAQAALWCGLTPLLCDIDPQTWLPDVDAERALVRQYGREIAVIVPNATFGNLLDLAHYDQLSAESGIPVVIDAAASLGAEDHAGAAFGSGCRHALVYSMHATKAFSTGEGGLIYSADSFVMQTLRTMSNFGFGQSRSSTMPGLNAKLSEVSALLGLAKLDELDGIVSHRSAMHALYQSLLPDLTFQRQTGARIAHQFVPLLLPQALAGKTEEIIGCLADAGIGAGRYFVPHLAEQPFFQQTCLAGDLPKTEAISRRVIALPMSDQLDAEDVTYICDALRGLCRPSLHRGATIAPSAGAHP